MLDGFRPEHPALTKGSLVGSFRARQRPGVGGDGPRAGAGGAGFYSDDGDAAGDPAGNFHELPARREALYVGEDHIGVGVVLPRLQQVHFGDVGLVAQAHEVGEADAGCQGPVEDGRAERP